MRSRTLLWPLVALVVLIIEISATVGTVSGEPFAPVAGWGPTRPADVLTFVLVVLGCATLAALDRLPLTVATIATACFVVFALRNHELGLFLPPMVAVLALAARARHRLAAIVSALVSLAAALAWVAQRAGGIADSGTAMLAWVAFGSVLAVFFLGPLLVGEIVRVRLELRGLRAAGRSR